MRQNMDYVKCTYCGKQSLVATGSDVCPQCGTDGSLQWVDENDPEDANGVTDNLPFLETCALLGGDYREQSDANAVDESQGII